MDLITAIPTIRNSTVAILKYRAIASTNSVGVQQQTQYECGWGSGVCIVDTRYILTAFHILNNGQLRDPADGYVAFVVPQNGNIAYHFPVIGFPLERQDLDIAILEIGPCATAGINITGLPVTLASPVDGTEVVTVGFPAPEIAGLGIDPQGTYIGGQFFLKSHGNEGIVSAQYPLGPVYLYEFNVGWHHGESGGPVALFSDQLAILTIMQQYRNVTSPHGVMAGPHRGCSFSLIQQDLVRLGARII
jgi:hypothetical protein